MRVISAVLTLAIACIAMPAVSAIKPNELRVDNRLENGEFILSGYFGSMWSEDEIKALAASECKQNGKKLSSFSTHKGEKAGSTGFRATCK
ncbi:MAG: hypothetical protein ACPGVK_06535 [Halocynthiibacter sp.]